VILCSCDNAPVRRAALIIAVGLAFTATARSAPADSIVTRGLKQVRGRTYFLYLPPDIKPDEKLPLIVALHGSGRDGRTIVEPWQALAKRERLIVAGPNAQNAAAWYVPADGPDLLYFLVDEIAAEHPVDRRRVYLFGHSGGAIFALTMAVLEPEYFAAVAIHAGALAEGVTDELLNAAARRIPTAIFVGDRDPLFPLDVVRKSRDRLAAAGYPVSFHEIPSHDHNYYARSRQINEDAWQFLKPIQLTGEPKYAVHNFR
jgi:poly(3-hydroxybutyrate) depolymerase